MAVDDRFVSSIKGNIAQVPVNNFIATEKTPLPKTSKIYNTRPFSSDNKERDRRARLHPSETSMASTLKNPYESKLVNRGPLPRRREEPRNLMMIHDRPYSAKVTEDRKKSMRHPAHNPLA